MATDGLIIGRSKCIYLTIVIAHLPRANYCLGQGTHKDHQSHSLCFHLKGLSSSSGIARVVSRCETIPLVYTHILLSLTQGSAWLNMRVTSTPGPLMGKMPMAVVTMGSSS